MPNTEIWIGVTNAWATGSNWNPSNSPGASDIEYIQNNSQSIASYDGSSITLASLNIDMSYLGAIAEAGTYLKLKATVANIGTQAVSGGAANGRWNLNICNSGAVVNVFGSANAATDPGSTPIRLLLTSGVLNVSAGKVGVALAATETASIATLTMLQGAGVPAVTLGAGVTLTTGYVLAGTLTNYSANTTTAMTVNGKGSLLNLGTGAFTTLNIFNGRKVTYQNGGTITTLNISGVLDLSTGVTADTITNCNRYGDSWQIIDPAGRITYTNPPTDYRRRIGD